MSDTALKKETLCVSRRSVIKAATGLIVAGIAMPSISQSSYPNKPIRVVIPYPPGGPTDIVGRIVCHALSENWGQPVTIENKPGATGMIGADIVAKAPPNGYTLLINVSGHIVNPAIYSKMPHDSLKDFTPITNLAYTPIQLVVGSNFPANSVKELVSIIKANPGKYNFASSSPGVPGHLMGELFKQIGNLDVVHIPYKGSAPALTDVVGGQISFMFDSMPSSINLVKTGRLKSLGVSSSQRVASLPNVPTFAEQGFAELDLTTWYGLWGPANMPTALTKQIYDEVSKVLATPDVRRRIQDALAEPMGENPEKFNVFCHSEAKRYAQIVKAAGIKID